MSPIGLCVVLFVTTVTGEVIYRNYKAGDEMSSTLYNLMCVRKSSQPPCFVAVDMDEGPHVIIIQRMAPAVAHLRVGNDSLSN